MTASTGNLSKTERLTSATFGLALSLLALRRGSAIFRTVSAATGSALLARAAAGHCAMKAAISGRSSFRQGLTDQWRYLRGAGKAGAGSLQSRAERGQAWNAVDESVAQSFPASDPPSTHAEDVPPVNAEDKWRAARAAEGGEA